MTNTPTVSSELIVLLLTCAMLSYASPVQAQDKDKQQDDKAKAAEDRSKSNAPEADEIVVTARTGGGGQRRGRIGESASRDMLEDSYEDNVEDFLDDLGGISTMDGDDEGNLFSFQGMAPEMNQLTLGGQRQGRSGPGIGNMPTDMVERISVIKTPMPSMEEGASGGTVNVELRSPANLKRQLFGLRSNLTRASGTGKLDPNMSSYFGQSFQDGKWGILLSAGYKNTNSKIDMIKIKSWEQRSVEGYTDEVWAPNSINSSVTMANSERFSGSAIFGYRPTYALDISLNANFSHTLNSMSYATMQGVFAKQRELSVSALNGDIVTALDSNDPRRSNLRVQISDRDTKAFSQSYTLDLKWVKAGNRVHASAGYSRNEQSSPKLSSMMTFSKNALFGYRLLPAESFSVLTVDPVDVIAEGFGGRAITFSDNRSLTSNLFTEVNMDKRVKNAVFRRFKIGAKYRRTLSDRSQDKGKYFFDAPLQLDSVEDAFITDSFLGYVDDPAVLHSWPYADIDGIIERDNISPDYMNTNLPSVFDVTQQTYGAYTQGDFRFTIMGDKAVFGNIGVRYVHTDILSHGFQGTEATAVAVENNSRYDDILPSATISARLSRRIALELGLARVITRPNLAMLSSSQRINESNETGSSGNSQLQPFRANQVMAELSYFQNRQSRYKFSAAYKDVDSFYFRNYSLQVIDDTGYLITSPVNGYNASILSLNLETSHNLGRLLEKLAAFSLKASFSYNKSKTNFIDPATMRPLPLPQITPHVAKLTLSYTKDKLSARVRYQWQSKTLRIPSSLSGLPEWQQSYGNISVGANYTLMEGVRLSFDVRNLLNAHKLNYINSPLQLAMLQQRGRRITLGLKASF